MREGLEPSIAKHLLPKRAERLSQTHKVCSSKEVSHLKTTLVCPSKATMSDTKMDVDSPLPDYDKMTPEQREVADEEAKIRQDEEQAGMHLLHIGNTADYFVSTVA